MMRQQLVDVACPVLGGQETQVLRTGLTHSVGEAWPWTTAFLRIRGCVELEGGVEGLLLAAFCRTRAGISGPDLTFDVQDRAASKRTD
jgi:hypothetical protein